MRTNASNDEIEVDDYYYLGFAKTVRTLKARDCFKQTNLKRLKQIKQEKAL